MLLVWVKAFLKNKKEDKCYLLLRTKLLKKWISPSGLNGNYFLSICSSETVSFFLPFALLEASTLRPLAVAILSRNPCLFFLFRFDG
jgi:hypothetical protein